HHFGPGLGESVFEVEDVGHRVPGRGDTGAPGQGDLPEAEVLDLRGPLATDEDQLVAVVPCLRRRQVVALGRVTGVRAGPVGPYFQVVDFGESAVSDGLGCGG